MSIFDSLTKGYAAGRDAEKAEREAAERQRKAAREAAYQKAEPSKTGMAVGRLVEKAKPVSSIMKSAADTGVKAIDWIAPPQAKKKPRAAPKKKPTAKAAPMKKKRAVKPKAQKNFWNDLV